ncbi:hypothetical protein BV25DRAFT_1361826 [Artomyces pyxidatus]|uniref:Uncharacterized protein n=1 Tax=Artomyces pyxidatus TaxID=48021 RepID=A0ACB8SPM0_9AGAM|nr:hypothetical protein BV25DRAFT_1361826 [Artomyces pyxidatus]
MQAPHDMCAAPVMEFPNELQVVGHISSFAVSTWPPRQLHSIQRDESSPPGRFQRLDIGWINITHVCKCWRNIAMSQASLWKDVDLLILPERWALELMRRSAPGPFDLTSGPDIPDKIKRRLQAGGFSRLRDLVFHDNSARSAAPAARRATL